jgi:hypothetical protein
MWYRERKADRRRETTFALRIAHATRVEEGDGVGSKPAASLTLNPALRGIYVARLRRLKTARRTRRGQVRLLGEGSIGPVTNRRSDPLGAAPGLVSAAPQSLGDR